MGQKRIFSDEHRRKLSEALKGRKLSGTHLKNVRSALKRNRTKMIRALIGRKLSPEHRQNIGDALRGRPKPLGFGDKVRKAHTGKIVTQETRDKIGAATRGRPRPTGFTTLGRKHTEAEKEHLREVMRDRPSPMKGRKHTPEARAKMSFSRTGRRFPNRKKVSDETRQKMSLSRQGNKYRLGIPHTEETKKRIGEAAKGRKHTPEEKRKISAANSGSNNANWKGGGRTYRGDGWHQSKRAATIRDNGICLRCEVCPPRGRPDVHHIVPFRICEQLGISIPNDARNLICLCKRCHGWAETHLEESIPQLQSILSEKYGYSYPL